MALWLDEKFLLQVRSRLKLFKKTGKGLYNCRCPYCGDSKKSNSKARGYFYTKDNNMFFDCKNCGKGTTFSKFLEWFDPELYKEYVMEMFQDRSTTRRKRKPKTPKMKFNKVERKVEKEKNKLLELMTPVSEMPEGSLVLDYVKNRVIPYKEWENLYFCPNIKEITQHLEKYKEKKFTEDPKLVFPFFNVHGQLTHLQFRAITNVDKKYRFITIELIDDIKRFGVQNIDPDKPVRICESPIDSFYVDNAIAMAGSSVPYHEFDPKKDVFVYDNEPRNKEIVKFMKKAIQKGFGVVIWGQDMKYNDINDMIIGTWNRNELNEYITSHTFRGLTAENEMLNFK